MEPDIQPNATTPGQAPTPVTPGVAQVKTRPSDGTEPEPAAIPVQPVIPITQNPIPTSLAVPEIPDVVLETPTSPVPTTDSKEMTIEEKLEAARLAMEGPVRSAERQQREREEMAKSESAKLEAEKEKIEKEKEKLELGWIDLDTTRTSFKKDLEPIMAEETKIEEEEKGVENEEELAALLEQKQAAEKKRQALEDKRKDIEQRKWLIQDKIAKVEKLINENTQKYQPLLDQEEAINDKMDKLKKELI